jgi:very-short-patch-repair endonuclease
MNFCKCGCGNEVKRTWHRGHCPRVRIAPAWNKGKGVLRVCTGRNRSEAARLRALNMSLEQRSKISATLSGRRNPEHSIYMKRKWQDPVFREKLIPHLVEISAIHHKPSSLELILYTHLKETYPSEEIFTEYRIQTANRIYRVDFAIPRINISFEADGDYWHRDKERDIRRQEAIEACGWQVIRFSESELNTLGDKRADE